MGNDKLKDLYKELKEKLQETKELDYSGTIDGNEVDIYTEDNEIFVEIVRQGYDNGPFAVATSIPINEFISDDNTTLDQLIEAMLNNCKVYEEDMGLDNEFDELDEDDLDFLDH